MVSSIEEKELIDSPLSAKVHSDACYGPI